MKNMNSVLYGTHHKLNIGFKFITLSHLYKTRLYLVVRTITFLDSDPQQVSLL